MPAHNITTIVDLSGDKLVNNPAWRDIDSVNLSITFTTTGGWLLFSLSGTVYIASLKYLYLDFTVDGVRCGQTCGVQYGRFVYESAIHLTWLCQLPPGTYTIRPQWASSATANHLLAASPASSPAVFTVMELL